MTSSLYAGGRNRIAAVKLLSAAALSLLNAQGNIELRGNNVQSYRIIFKGITIAVQTPFFMRLKPSSQTKYLGMLLSDFRSVQFQLDIWSPDKVLNVARWDDKLDIVSFRRGAWEELILEEARRVGFEPSQLSAIHTSH